MASRPRTTPPTSGQRQSSTLPAGLKGGLTPKQVTRALQGKPAKTLTAAGQRRALALAVLHEAGQQGGQ